MKITVDTQNGRYYRDSEVEQKAKYLMERGKDFSIAQELLLYAIRVYCKEHELSVEIHSKEHKALNLVYTIDIKGSLDVHPSEFGTFDTLLDRVINW